MHEVSTKIGGHLVMAGDDQKLRVRLVDRNGRRRYEAASKERLVASCLEPGVSVSRLALEHGVNANLLRKWIKKHTATRSLPRSPPSAFIPVQLEGASDRALSRGAAWRWWVCRRLAMKCAGRNPRGLQLFVLRPK